MFSEPVQDIIVDELITLIIETNWHSDEDIYITENQKQLLNKFNATEQFKDAFFEDLVDRYQGSCDSISSRDFEFLEDFDLFSDLYNIQFQCDTCGWWFEEGEQGESNSGDMLCKDCAEEEE